MIRQHFIKNLKRFIYIFTLAILLTTFLPPHRTNAEPSSPTVYAPSCILMDANSGKILYSKNANEKMYPASTTKVMTAILALEKCNLTDTATVSHNAIFSVPVGYSHASLKEGEILTIEQLLYVLLIPSANDAAFVLAEHIGGSVDGFSKMMNDKAIELGCKNTNFVNPNGIHSEEHYSTAYDLSLMGKYAMKFDTFRKIVSTKIYTLPTTNKYDTEDRIFANTNELIKPSNEYYYQYATGAKTGYTDAAQHCIIATAKKDNTELIVVILHDLYTEGIRQRPIDCKTLFEYGFNNYTYKEISLAGTVVKNISVKKASLETKNLDLITQEDVIGLVNNSSSDSSVIENITLNDNITVPISKGDVLGSISYLVDGSSYTTSLIASHDVSEFNYKKLGIELAVAIVVLIILYIKLKISSKKRRKTKSNIKKNSSSGRSKNRKVSYYSDNFYPRY